ncbi:phosphoribosylglycinamide formyltransferase [uncultured Shewanella sp.]|uniref:phosphoribosylglycinamide formyltransferase n=1 Tax=uncultured Shewanella sp. TaxID=173975 RepID=UPI00261D5D51|nr:phosphoribosylglycinamide formyltransferase [uncultured Shewanella sp.]
MSQPCRILVLISGSGSNLQAIMDSCDDNPQADIVGVISNNPNAYGLTRAHMAEVNTSCIIPHQGENRLEYDKRLIPVIDQYQPDLIVLAGFMRILSDELVLRYEGKMINIHPSLLPKYPGLNTHKAVLASNDKEHGASVHFVIPKLDAGPVILQANVPVFDEDTPDTLTERVHEQEHRIYPLVVKWFSLGRLKMHANQAFLDDQCLPINGYAPD